MSQQLPPSIRLPRARRVALDDPDAHQLGTPLRRLAAKLQQRKTQQTTLSEYLPNSLREHIRFGEFRNGELCLMFSSAAWLTRARYEQHVLIESLRQHPDYRELQSLRLIVVLTPR